MSEKKYELSAMICRGCKTRHDCDTENCSMSEVVAEYLLVNGYGNVKQAVSEFAEKVKKFLDGVEVYFYNGEEEGIWDSIAVAEQINELLKEVCGE